MSAHNAAVQFLRVSLGPLHHLFLAVRRFAASLDLATVALGVDKDTEASAAHICGAGDGLNGDAINDSHLVVSLFASSYPHNTARNTPRNQKNALDRKIFRP
jgi:hypothetical protein